MPAKTSVATDAPLFRVDQSDRAWFGTPWNNGNSESFESTTDESVSLDTSDLIGLESSHLTLVSVWHRDGSLAVGSDVDGWTDVTQAVDGPLMSHDVMNHYVGWGLGGGNITLDFDDVYEGGWILYKMNCEQSVWEWAGSPLSDPESDYIAPGPEWSGGPPFQEAITYDAANPPAGGTPTWYATHWSVVALTGSPFIDDTWVSVGTFTGVGGTTSDWIFTSDPGGGTISTPNHYGFSRTHAASVVPTSEFEITRPLPGPVEERDYSTRLSVVRLSFPMRLVGEPPTGGTGGVHLGLAI